MGRAAGKIIVCVYGSASDVSIMRFAVTVFVRARNVGILICRVTLLMIDVSIVQL